MLALAVLATVAAGAVEVQPRPGWREPLCLFVAVGMDAGSRKSGVFTTLTRPVADVRAPAGGRRPPGDHRDRDPAADRRPGRRPPPRPPPARPRPASRRKPGPRPSPGPPRPPTWWCRRCRGGWSMTPPPRPWPGCWPPTAASLLLSPEGDVFDQMAGRYNQAAGPQPRCLPQGPRWGPAQGRPPRPAPEYVSGRVDHRPHRAARGAARAGQPARIRRPGAAGPVPPTASRRAWSAAARPAPHRPAGGGRPLRPRTRRPWPPAWPLAGPASYRPALLTLDQAGRGAAAGFERDLEPRLAAGSGDLAHLAGWAAKLAGATCRLAGLLHLAGYLRDGWAQPIGADTFAGAIRLADYLVEHARAVFDLMGADPRVDDARWLLDWISRTGQAQFSRRDAHQAARGRSQGGRPGAGPRLLEEHG